MVGFSEPRMSNTVGTSSTVGTTGEDGAVLSCVEVSDSRSLASDVASEEDVCSGNSEEEVCSRAMLAPSVSFSTSQKVPLGFAHQVYHFSSPG